MAHTIKYFTLGIGVTAGVILGAGAGTAHADVHICVGGYTDPGSGYISDVKAAQGDPCNVPIQWPAQIGINGELLNTQGSLNIGVPNTVNAYDAAGNQPVRLEGFSLGSAVVAQAGDYIKWRNGGVLPGNLQVITNGNPWGDSGIANDPGIAGWVFNVTAPFVAAPENIPQMGINRNNANDIWGNSANQLPQVQIAQVSTVGQNHTLPDPNTPHDTYISPDGVQNEVYGGSVNAISAATPIPEPINTAFNVGFPTNNPATSPVPSFFGELPCIAPDGGQYFTPADAPC
jgi:hypothetical protein